MNKKKQMLTVLLILAVGLSAYAIYRFNFRKSIPETELNKQVRAILMNNGCLDCHSPNASVPFYGTLPIAKDWVHKDIQNGTRYIDLEKVCRELEQDTKVSEVDLAKIEQSMINESMYNPQNEKSAFSKRIVSGGRHSTSKRKRTFSPHAHK